jgi:Arc/MetJ family transcription regulator
LKHQRGSEETPVRTTINIDEELLAEAERLTGHRERSVLVREGLKALIEREGARRLPPSRASRRAPVTEEQPPVRKKRPLNEFLAEIHAAQKARGHVPRTREEVDRELAEERASWDR